MLWVLPPWVTLTDTAREEKSDGNNTVTQVRTSFVLCMGLFIQTSLGFGQLPSSCFQAAPVSQWLSALLQAAGANTPVRGIPIPGPFLCHGGCTDQLNTDQRVQLGD